MKTPKQVQAFQAGMDSVRENWGSAVVVETLASLKDDEEQGLTKLFVAGTECYDVRRSVKPPQTIAAIEYLSTNPRRE